MKKIKLTVLISSIIIVSLCGCKQVKQPVSKTGVYFDTVINITLYESNSSEIIDDCFEIADNYEHLLSKTIDDSDVGKINNSYNEWISVNEKTYEVIKTGLKYEALSDGRFSIVCGSITDLWDIGIIPSDDEIQAALELCGQKNIKIDDTNHSVMVTNKGSKIDLGAVAKGFIADEMKEYLLSKGVKNGIIQLGGNVLLIGDNPTKEDGFYNIGINKPFSNDNEVITAVSEKDNSIVTSGNYQRYFEYNGKKYHHIIDLKTGYPAESGLNSATIICDKSVDADCLSTICFIYGIEQSETLLDDINSESEGSKINALFIDNNKMITEY